MERKTKKEAEKERLEDQRRKGHLAKREEVPAEEFTGVGESGESPEFKPEERRPRARRNTNK